MIFDADDSIKDQVVRSIEKGSRKVGESTLIWEQSAPPFVDTSTGKVVGLVEVTYLTDKSCAECYDVVRAQRSILQQFGLAIGKENVLDRADKVGRSLIDRYSIVGLPTIVLSEEAQSYDILTEAWKQVGTVEEDGVYVFRKVEALGQPYRDLTSEEVVNIK